MPWAGTTLLNLMNPGYAAYVCVYVCIYVCMYSEAGRYVKYEVTLYCYSHFRTCMDIIGRADIFMFIYDFCVVLVYL